MDRILVIADDFTGAGDTGVQFVNGGWDIRIEMEPEKTDSHSSVVIDTETRNLSSDEAYCRLKDMIGKLDIDCFGFYFKKVDSVLRGNICAELKAMKEAVRPDVMVFNPANPKAGRTVIHGVVQVDGIDLCKTALSRDPLSPVQNDCIKSFLEQGLGEPAVYVTQEEIKNKEEKLTGCKNIIFDAQTEMDLENAVRLFAAAGKKILWAGSAGLAGAAARVFGKNGPVLSMIGSITEISQKQVCRMAETGAKLVELDIFRLLDGGTAEAAVEEAVQALRSGTDVVVVSAGTKEDYIRSVTTGEQLGYTGEEIAKFTQEQFGIAAGKIMESAAPKGLILSGGDTAVSVMKKFHVSSVVVLEEVLPSIPLCRMEDGDYPGLLCITKSGSFGSENALVEAVNYMKRISSSGHPVTRALRADMQPSLHGNI